MAITRTAMIDDDGSGTTGTILNNAWKQELYNQIDAVAPDVWIDVPYDPANFTAATGAWTVTAGNHVTFAYRKQGTLAVLQIYLSATAVSAATASLTIHAPAALGTWRYFMKQPVSLFQTSGQMGLANFNQGDNLIHLTRDVAATPFAADQLFVSGALLIAL